MAGAPPPFGGIANFGYDLGAWPYKLYVDPTIDAITGTPFTLSSGTEIARISHQFDSTASFLIDDFPTFQSNETNLTLLNEGDDIDYNRRLVYYTPIDAIVDRMIFNLGLGLQVSAYTSGNFRTNRINITFEAWKANGQLAKSQDIAQNISTTNMTAVDNQIVIFNETYTSPLPLYAGGALVININIDNVAGVGTFQKGIMASFPYQATGGMRTYSKSGIVIYCRPNANKESSMFAPTYFSTLGGIG